ATDFYGYLLFPLVCLPVISHGRINRLRIGRTRTRSWFSPIRPGPRACTPRWTNRTTTSDPGAAWVTAVAESGSAALAWAYPVGWVGVAEWAARAVVTPEAGIRAGRAAEAPI